MQRYGDIKYRNNIKFKEDGVIDYKLGGHPTMNLTDGNDGRIYFLVMTSNCNMAKSGNGLFYEMIPDRSNTLKCKTYLNLNYIYYVDKDTITKDRYVGDYDLKNISKLIYENIDMIKDKNKDIPDYVLSEIEQNAKQNYKYLKHLGDMNSAKR